MGTPFDDIAKPLPQQPIQVGGSTITAYDDISVDLTTPSGVPMRIPLANAPPGILAALGRVRDTGPIAPLGGNPQLDVDLARAGQVAARSAPPSPAPPRPTAPIPQQEGDVDLEQGARIAALPPLPLPLPLPPPPQVDARAPYAATPSQQDPVDVLQQRLRDLQAQPQYAVGGGGVRTTTQRQGIDPNAVSAAQDAQTDVDLARTDQAMANEEAAAAEGEGKLAIAAVGEQLASELERVKAEGEADARTERTRMEAETSKLQALQKAAQTEIDPKRFWNSKSTGGQIMGAIAIALGAAAQAYGVRDNPALTIIERAISNDIAAQESNRADKRTGAAQQSQMMERVQQMYATADDRRRAFTLAARERAAVLTDSLANKTIDKTIRAQAQAFAAKIREQNALDAQAFLLKTADQVSTTQQQVPGGGLRPTQAKQQADALEARMYAKYDPEAQIPLSSKYFGVPMQAIGGKEDARAVNKQLAEVEGIERTLDSMLALVPPGHVSVSTLNPKTRDALTALHARAVIQLNRAAEGGALDEGSIQLAKEQLGGDPKGGDTIPLLRFGGTSALHTVKSAIRAAARDTLRNRGTIVNPDARPLVERLRPLSGSAPPPSRPDVQQ